MVVKIPEKYTLKQLRTLRGLSRQELADVANLDYNTILNYENDVNKLRKAKYETVEMIADILGATVDDIFLNSNSD